MTTGYVHWEEGLFLRPHHLQMMQRQTFEHMAVERRFFHTFPYGVIESRVSPDELRNKLIRFEMLQAIMPSGLFVDVGANAELPSMDFSKAFDASADSLNRVVDHRIPGRSGSVRPSPPPEILTRSD